MKTLLVTGGAGFIGVNSAAHFAARGWRVVVADNLSRRGAEDNLRWLTSTHDGVRFERADVRDAAAMEQLVDDVQPHAVLHLAAQVAVTTSVNDPRADFETNATGTFNVLEAVRRRSPASFFINASTNKVYGKMEGVDVVLRDGRYAYAGLPGGVDERQPLEFHSPYGCSKGAADQYTQDYARIYGLKTVTMRQSCIYGPHQYGIEDQGWVAWFCIAALLERPITIFGDGRQVRDVLNVADLARAYECAIDQGDAIAGEAFNLGGGPSNTLSLLELVALLERQLGKRIPLRFEGERPGDQRVFICDIGKARARLGWSPTVGTEEGIAQLVEWVAAQRERMSA